MREFGIRREPLLGLVFLALSLSAPAQPALRFSLPPGALSPADCVAQPGNVPVTLNPTNTNLEIVDWTAAQVSTNHLAEFTLRFRAPITDATVIAYEPGEVSCRVSNEWRTLVTDDSDRKLQVIPFPFRSGIDTLRFVIPGRLAGAPGDPKSGYRATLPFVTLVPLRMEDIAAAASVSSSPVGSSNDPMSLVDGEIKDTHGFAAPHRATPRTHNALEWAALTWPEPVAFRGLMLFHDASSSGRGRIQFDSFTGSGGPTPASGTNHWQTVTVRSTQPGAFRENQVFVSPQPVRTRGLRLSWADNATQSGLSEVLVLAESGSNPALVQPHSKDRTWTIPKVAAGRIVVDGEDGDWPEGRTNGFALAFDDERLFLVYSARGATASFANGGTNVNELFHTGDAIDLMLQTRADLDSHRREPGLGDIRLVFSLFNSKPVGVLYDYRVEDLLVVPVIYKSGEHEVSCERVNVLKESVVQIRQKGDRLTVEASVPLAAIHLDPQALRTTRGDVGRISRNATTQARHARWANRSVNEVADVAEAAELHPHRWGTFRFEQPR